MHARVRLRGSARLAQAGELLKLVRLYVELERFLLEGAAEEIRTLRRSIDRMKGAGMPSLTTGVREASAARVAAEPSAAARPAPAPLERPAGIARPAAAPAPRAPAEAAQPLQASAPLPPTPTRRTDSMAVLAPAAALAALIKSSESGALRGVVQRALGSLADGHGAFKDLSLTLSQYDEAVLNAKKLAEFVRAELQGAGDNGAPADDLGNSSTGSQASLAAAPAASPTAPAPAGSSASGGG